jgi:beta-galactosidase
MIGALLGLAILTSAQPSRSIEFVTPRSIAGAQQEKPAVGFSFVGEEFRLDGKPFQIVSGEMHPARIPAEYWRHRIQMARATGCNTISAYVFWNYQEPKEGVYDFESGNHNLGKFLKTCQEEGMKVILRPGPYCCAEWDFGGIPAYLLKYPDLKVRCMDPHYIQAAGKYLKKLATVVKPFMSQNGGPILMVQVENEYGSYGNDRKYVTWLHHQWTANGIQGPFYTADGATPYMLEAGSLPGCAVGLDPGTSDTDFDVAHKMNPGVPVMSSETYPGWLTHWGESWAKVNTEGISKEVDWLLSHKKSFSLYVVHGGTNFGWTAGANSGSKGYEPHVTSYDYDAPITEQGQATPKFMALRTLIGKYKQVGAIPEPIKAISIPSFSMKPSASIWDLLPKPIALPQPKPFESLGLDHGFVLYRTRLVGHKSGSLTVHDLHDYATVFIDGKYVGSLDRRAGKMSLRLPEATSALPELDILVEGMGHMNFAEFLIDRKGITDRVTLDGMTLMDWQAFTLPMDESWVMAAPSRPKEDSDRPGKFFKGIFSLESPSDTYLDLSGFEKGLVWVNGHNLGRFWKIGPQQRLYCPAPWLKKGENRVVVFDLHKVTEGSIAGFATSE